MKNLGQMMKKAQEMQARMEEMQTAIDAHEVTGASGGGSVQIRVNGRMEVRAVSIDPSVIDSDEVEMLEDLIAAAINDAKTQVDAYKQKQMAEITDGLPLPPGMKLPF